MSFFTRRAKFLTKTSVISVMAASIVAFSHGPAAAADIAASGDSLKSTTIYHLYLNGTYIGNVTDKAVIDELSARKLDTTGPLGNFSKSPVQYIPEETIYSVLSNNQIQTISNIFQLKAEAAAVVIDGRPVVYVADKQTAEAVIRNLKLQYVSEKQLNKWETQNASAKPAFPPLKTNETRVLDIRLSKKVSIDSENVPPEKIMSLTEAESYLKAGTLIIKKYAAKDGDTMESIASQYHLKLSDLLAINPGLTKGSILNIGQEINTLESEPYVQVFVDKEVNRTESIPFTKEIMEDSTVPKGETKVKQEGQNGSSSVIYHISEQNGQVTKKDKESEQILKQPTKQIVLTGTKEIPFRGEGAFAWPAIGGYISSQMGYRWGKLHKGIDIARPEELTILAADNGVVTFAGWSNGYGNKVVIDHQNGFQTLYGHMASLKVKAGQTVTKGSAIGIMGATGDATGIHLHFEVYKNGSLVNPLLYVSK